MSQELFPAVSQLSMPWEGNENPCWLASKLSFERNIEGFKFPSKMSGEKRLQVIDLVSKELLQSTLLSKPELLRAEKLSPLDKEYLVEHFLATQNLQSAHVGEAFLIDTSGLFFAALNLTNHIHLSLLDSSEEIEASWNKLVQIEATLGNALHYAFSTKFGFLTSDPRTAGTAMTAAIYLQLSALAQSGELEGLINKHRDDQVIIGGLHGGVESIGDIVMVKNRFTLGVNEESILSSLRNAATKLQASENSARAKLREQERPTIKDHVSRAYGLLMYSYQLEAIEALNAISLLKLGVDLGWVKGISLAELNGLLFSCRRAHLIGKVTGNVTGQVSPELLPHLRAEYIHRSLSSLSLSF